jgi:RimJ/RimL family protein N-acetyltransferase
MPNTILEALPILLAPGSGPVSPAVRLLFNQPQPIGIRLNAILDGTAQGILLVDDPDHPSMAFIQELADRQLYFGGAVTLELLAQLVDRLRQDSELSFGFWPQDWRARPKYPFLHPTPDYIGVAIDFTDRDPQVHLSSMAEPPLTCRLARTNLNLLERLNDDWPKNMFGSFTAALQYGLGYCLLGDNDEILSNAFAGPASGGLIEIGVGTPPEQRGMGYATIVCARLIKECESLGYQTFWNTNMQNLPSVGLARKLGYRTERPWRVYWWDKAEEPT